MTSPLLFFLFLSLLSAPSKSAAQIHSDGHGFISATISEKGLAFVKDLLVEEALSSLTSLRIPKIQKSINIPFVGGVHVSLSNITLSRINVSSSSIVPHETGVVIVASGATANISMDWCYKYSTWLLPVDISDKGRAFVQVEGMEVGIAVKMKNQEGSLKLSVMECGCYLKDISIILDGGASWFYQGLVNAFEGQIRSTVENAITKKIKDGIVKLDTVLQELPKEIRVDDIAALNVTFMNDPLLQNSSVAFEINGLFSTVAKVATFNYHLTNSQNSAFFNEPLKMLWISLDEAVLNSASDTYFMAGMMQWTVNKVPEQSLLNTAGWKYIVPQLHRKYPNDDMQLNITLSSPPIILVAPSKISATVTLDMVIEVLDGNEIVPVACLLMDISASGFLEILGNNLAGEARLDDFVLSLKWSKVGNFHMYLVQTAVRVFLKDVALPYVNSHLRKGFPLPIVRGFTLKDANIVCTDSRIVVCSDVTFTDSFDVKWLPMKYW